jgi:hypothetical protein
LSQQQLSGKMANVTQTLVEAEILTELIPNDQLINPSTDLTPIMKTISTFIGSSNI